MPLASRPLRDRASICSQCEVPRYPHSVFGCSSAGSIDAIRLSVLAKSLEMTVSQRATIRQNDAFGSRLENGRDSKENSEGENLHQVQPGLMTFCIKTWRG